MSKHTPGPWFIWKEEAYKREGMDKPDIEAELLELCRDHDVMAYQSENIESEIERGYARGCRVLFTLNVDDHDDNSEECLANARLACAAPELLEALEAITDLYDTDDGCRSTPEYIAARAAIAKARNEQ